MYLSTVYKLQQHTKYTTRLPGHDASTAVAMPPADWRKQETTHIFIGRPHCELSLRRLEKTELKKTFLSFTPDLNELDIWTS